MAQVDEGRVHLMRRVRLVMRQRPLLGVAVALVTGLLLGAAAFGVVQAGGLPGGAAGVEIERGGGAGEDAGAGGRDDGKDGPCGSGSSDDDPDGDGTGFEDGLGDFGDKRDKRLVVVDVAGAVHTPMVVEVPEGARVRDAIEAAGGLADDADVSGVNRAAKVVDGQQVYIPRVGEAAVVGTPGAAGTVDVGASGGSGASACININTASVEELDELPGVGPATAQAIVDERTANGPFSAPEDLMRVSGIGEKKYAKLESAICV